jgi:nucleotide-binding universal stress UspA family protein
MFARIMIANDGSKPAVQGLAFALKLAKQNASELHMVSIEEIDYMPEFVEEVREEADSAARRYRGVVKRARELADKEGVAIETHILRGHPVRDIVRLIQELKIELLVIGATGHSGFYERIIGSRADRIVQLSTCPVLVVK